MSIDRFPQLEKNLNRLYAQLGAAEDGMVGAISKIDKIKYHQEIDDEIRPQIRKFEDEWFALLQQESQALTFGETEAQATIEVIAQEVERVRLQPDLSEQVLGVLGRIEAKLNEPGVTADAKLKGTLSVFPPFIGLAYEGQIDTENFCRKYFPTFTRLIKGTKKVAAPDTIVSGARGARRFVDDRLSHLENQLRLLYEQLHGLEKVKIMGPDEEKVRLQQRVDAKWQEIRAIEQEYAQRLAQQVKRQGVPEPVAEIVVAELVDELELMQPSTKDDETRRLLMQILAELQKPGVPAAAKLKVAFPLVPGFVAIELEGDAESVRRRLFPTFAKAYEGIRSIASGDALGK